MSSEALSTRKRDDVDKGLLSMHCSSMVNTLAIGNYRCLLTSSQIPYCRCRQREVEDYYEVGREKYEVASNKNTPYSGGSRKLIGKRRTVNDKIDNRRVSHR
ncbi:hypothetical protein E5676_scaffold506G00760 [Cucumis melo var. makuwa]|uniref:Uncharacterized protein n=1 Tax=Cucumis melo var. makuwa TaxID=1194695 RepID=A0A5A7T4G2_CUCMM|nr:hypothetical protein E6C27_scaffold270G002560 [Cucumis melo var. makuwa]TYJ97021.1 hypothetical protein E5676_scaffold506G00760 [Cucumis melo var. makuwa]